MENHRRKGSSGDKFSFPIVPIPDHEFEFGSVTPSSPTSPADHLFVNGKLLPHYFPCQPTNYGINSLSRSTSRTSSVCSKDSLISSRSNSINSSRSSSCSSARTSTSETAPFSSDRKILSHHDKAKVINKNRVGKDWYQARNKPVLTPHYGSSQRWQFIAPAPALKHQGSSRGRKPNRRSCARDQELKSKKQTEGLRKARTWFGGKIFRAFVSACKECHAIKPSSRKRLDKN